MKNTSNTFITLILVVLLIPFLSIAGIKNNYENQMSTYDNIKGFSYNVDVDNDNEYKVVYKIDMNEISDTDLARFNVSRNFSDFRTTYEDLGYTCR